MPVRFLSDAELARLSSWPDEIAEHDLGMFFTLTSDDAVRRLVVVFLGHTRCPFSAGPVEPELAIRPYLLAPAQND